MNKPNKSNQIKLNVGFLGEVKTRVPGEKPLGAVYLLHSNIFLESYIIQLLPLIAEKKTKWPLI